MNKIKGILFINGKSWHFISVIRTQAATRAMIVFPGATA